MTPLRLDPAPVSGYILILLMKKNTLSCPIAFALILAAFTGAAHAQVTYEVDGVDTLGGNNVLWDDTATIWDSPFGVVATNAPGSNQTGGSATDNVIFGAHRTDLDNQNYRINNRDAGTINNLTLGSANSTFDRAVQLQIRGNAGRLQVDGLTTLGASNVTFSSMGGQLQLNQGNNSPELFLGDVTTVGDSDDNALILNANNAALNISGDIARGAGSRGADLRLVRGNLILNTTGGATTDTNAQTLDLDYLDLGNTNADAINGAFTFGAGKTVNAGRDIRVARNTSSANFSNSSTLNIHGTAVNSGRSVRIAETTANDVLAANTVGTINVGDAGGPGNGGSLTADSIIMGIQDQSGTGNAIVGNARGFLNIEDGATVDSRILTVADTGGAEGTVNVNDGTLTVTENIFLGGGQNNGNDAESTGVMNVGANGIVNAGLGAPITENFEVGRGGNGVLNVDGGTVNIGRGNLILGQNSNGTNTLNVSRGTVVLENGATVNVGDTYSGAGSNVDGFTASLNIQRGGGDITHTGVGTSLRIENDLNMQNATSNPQTAGASSNPDSSYTIDNGLLEVGRDFNARANTAGSNTLTLRGDAATVTVGRNFNGSQASFTAAFDFQNGSAISTIDVTGDGNVNNSTLDLLNTSGLAIYTGDILLFDIGGAQNGTFAGLPEGTDIAGTAYRITYQLAGSAGMNDIGLIQAIPEPSSLALLGFSGLLLYALRRRS